MISEVSGEAGFNFRSHFSIRSRAAGKFAAKKADLIFVPPRNLRLTWKQQIGIR
jgi:hypothetical protein